MPDVIDVGQQRAEEHQAAALARHKSRQKQWRPKPLEVDGERFCVVCGDDVLPERVAATNAVHCIACEERLERRARHGGF